MATTTKLSVLCCSFISSPLVDSPPSLANIPRFFSPIPRFLTTSFRSSSRFPATEIRKSTRSLTTSSSTRRHACAFGITSIVAFSCLGFWGEIGKRDLLDQKLIRKLVHINIGLVFMLCWPLFSSGIQGALFASLVPGLNIIRMLLLGLGVYHDEGTIKSMSRHGDRRELLKGPLYYALSITSACIFYWKSSPIAIAVICNLCAGDGMADIVGRRFGTEKLPYNKNKSFAGSIGMATAGFLASVGYMYYFASFGYIEDSGGMILRFLIISLASALVGLVTVSAFQTRKQYKEQEKDGKPDDKNYRQDLTMHGVVSVSSHDWLEKLSLPPPPFSVATRLYSLSSQVFLDLVDSVIADVASECHRVARLGLDRDLEVVEEELRLSVEARAKVADPSNNLETNTKFVVDIFGQTHPPVATEVFNCMNCGRQIVAGRFAPHLEKCMGKGRKARAKTTRSTTAAQNRNARRSPNPRYSPYPNSASENQLASGSPGVAGEDCSNGTVRENVKGD
ncbi:hypothetical protein ARALYDRAFT_332145 [Arabidopsis lyrata subsp. lyrata]|uniref:SAGA-associated factor 11 n=1 Tax=Arabidopsis lyrata subsp. lyrata TaxID=81972 RepID=D7MQE9_ARALL|nr:hypothetical protein ARALYDRAFT_332145 [Arabidopsis lyrata subsp. lyrata]